MQRWPFIKHGLCLTSSLQKLHCRKESRREVIETRQAPRWTWIIFSPQDSSYWSILWLVHQGTGKTAQGFQSSTCYSCRRPEFIDYIFGRKLTTFTPAFNTGWGYLDLLPCPPWVFMCTCAFIDTQIDRYRHTHIEMKFKRVLLHKIADQDFSQL